MESRHDDVLCFFHRTPFDLGAGYGAVTAAADGFHDELYVNIASRPGTDANIAVVEVVKREAGFNLVDVDQGIGCLGGNDHGIGQALGTAGDGDAVFDASA